MNHSDQILRIKAKLKAARQADTQHKVFGADSHQYQIGAPASEDAVRAFEARYGLMLPACYRAFVTEVGNGGPSFSSSAAGPFYGIYPLGGSVGEVLEDPERFLNKPAIVKPDMTVDEWEAQTCRIHGEEPISDEEYVAETSRIYSGLLPLGSQGCSSFHALVLNGPYAGRVVNLNSEGHRPKFAYEDTFLDWYERWLDEVVSGLLSQGGPSWFGYTMGGDDAHLMRVYDANADTRTKRIAALEGLGKLKSAKVETCRKLLDLCGHEDADIRHLALRMLTKFDYALAREPLHTHIAGDEEDCLAACQSIHWYARPYAHEWSSLLKARLPATDMPETCRFMCYLLDEAHADFDEELAKLSTHKHEEVRVTAFYTLGKSKRKAELVDVFIVGLDDPVPRVVHTVLQAVGGVGDKRLLAAYARVAERFEPDQDYLLMDLGRRLKEVGFESLEAFRDSLVR